jgi:hypothetical protein
VLKKGSADGSGGYHRFGLGGTTNEGQNASMNLISQASNQMDNDMQNQSNSNMSHQMSKDQIMAATNSQKALAGQKGTKKKMASEDDHD